MKIILGDNPFFGVNHRAGSKPLDSEEIRFSQAAEVIAKALESGIDTMMLSTHPGYERLLAKVDSILSGTDKLLNVALVLPNPHTLNSVVAEKGYGGLFRVIGVYEILKSSVDIFLSLFVNRKISLSSVFDSVINLELQRMNFKNIRFTHVCLHNVVTDILIGTGRVDVLKGFIRASQLLKLVPVIITQNSIRLLSLQLSDNYVACFTYNPIGYMVNPSLKEVEHYLITNINQLPNQPLPKLWAMQILASGASSVDNLINFESLEIFDSILYATTNPSRISPFVDVIKTRFG